MPTGDLWPLAERAQRAVARGRAAGGGGHGRRRRRATTRPWPCSAGSPGTADSATARRCAAAADADYLAEFLQRPRRLLRAVRRLHGGHGADAGDPVPRRRRLHPGIAAWGTAAGRSPRATRTPGRSCGSTGSAGCASSRHPRSDASVVAPDYAPADRSAGRPGDRQQGRVTGQRRASTRWPPPSRRPGRPDRWSACSTAIVLAGARRAGRGRCCADVVRRRQRAARPRLCRHAVNGAWEEVADSAIDLGQPWSVDQHASAGGRAAVARDGRRWPRRRWGGCGPQVEQVRYAQERAAQGPGSDERSAAVRADVRTVRAELRRPGALADPAGGLLLAALGATTPAILHAIHEPGGLGRRGAAEPVAAAAPSAGRTWKDE